MELFAQVPDTEHGRRAPVNDGQRWRCRAAAAAAGGVPAAATTMMLHMQTYTQITPPTCTHSQRYTSSARFSGDTGSPAVCVRLCVRNAVGTSIDGRLFIRVCVINYPYAVVFISHAQSLSSGHGLDSPACGGEGGL